MILRVPEYYEKFSCIASRCKDSCCAGWEIDIDEDSYAYYNSVEGKFGKRLKESMYEADPDDDGGGYRFKLKGKKRCAMLNDHNLCDLYTALGEEALCEVCTEYPRFSLIYGDVEQKALSLSCEEVGRILFERTEPEKLVDIELPGNCDDGEDDPAYVAFMEWVQQESVNILQNRTHNIPERMREFLAWCDRVQTVINYAQAKEDMSVLADWRYEDAVMNFGSGSRKILREKRSRFVHFLMKISRNVLRFLPIWKSWMRNGFTPRKNSKSCITKIPMRHF